jgi:hypothetical protein
MSHSTVLVVLAPDAVKAAPDVNHALSLALARFDENLEVHPYRDYIEKWQDEYGNALKYRTRHSGKIKALDELDVAEVLSEYCGYQVFEDSPDDGPVRYYSMSTYNPDSRWDWYVIGGRWKDRFPYRENLTPEQRSSLISGERSWTNEKDPPTFGHADGGRKDALDFERMRREAADAAGGRYDRFKELAAQYPDATSWATYRENYPDAIDTARELYGAQPLIAKIKEDHNSEFFSFFGPDVVEEFEDSREEYVAAAIADAVPGFALLTHEGQWIEPGRMGWWGMSDDSKASRADYNVKVNKYLDELPDDYLIILVDVHI